MKKLSIIFSLAAGVVMIGCSDVKREKGDVYMPDMAYSRAYETYADHNNLADSNIFYNNRPVEGTVARGEEMPFHVMKDAATDSTGYVAAKAVVNPLPALNATDMTEAERLYLVNCGICHGGKLDGNGPLYASGKFLAKPATLVGDAKYAAMPEGQMFYSVTYGKNLMGSYASQLTRKQRWMIIHYIKAKQAAGAAGATTTGTDSTKTAGSATTTKTK